MGESDSYYNPNQPANGQYSSAGYQQQYQPQPPPPSHPQYQQQPQQQPYQQGPPQNGNGYMPAQGYDGEKASFEEQFKVPKPKYNDLWAGILVC
jgi:hypothetical protein